MSTHDTLFDAVEADRLKEEGIARAVEWAHRDLFQEARKTAMRIACYRGTVTVDDVYADLVSRGLDAAKLKNAWGGVFRQGFKFADEWRKSARIGNHGRPVRVWRLRA